MWINQVQIPILMAIVAQGALCQSTLMPRKVSGTFSGTLPLVWTLEGQSSGQLAAASLRVLDESGNQALAPRGFVPVHVSGDSWQVVDQGIPAVQFLGMAEGRYTAEWTLQWNKDGQIRTERTEAVLRVGSKGDGWLATAFREVGTDGVELSAPTIWNASTTFRMSLSRATNLASIKYQVVTEGEESVLLAWKELTLNGDNIWVLPYVKGWTDGPAQLWVQGTDSQGRIWVHAVDVWLGATSGGAVPTAASIRNTTPKVSSTYAAKATSVQSLEAAAWPQLTWMEGLDNYSCPPWKSTNLIATVNVGYLDEERNVAKLWPGDEGRPMVLNLTGSDLLGKPVYNISYLLADRGTSSVVLESYADRALSIYERSESLPEGGAPLLPEGAATLHVGNAVAPVVMGAGVLNDFMGKPLVAGFGWAANSGGTIISANDWVKSNPSAPAIGLSAIRNGADLRKAILAKIIDRTGYPATDGMKNGSDWDPFALTVASQDPLGRILITKGFGGLHREILKEDESGSIRLLKPDPVSLQSNFDEGLPPWFTLGATARKRTVPNGNDLIILPPPWVRVTHVPATIRFDNEDGGGATQAWDESSAIEAGHAYVSVGRAFLGNNISVKITATGPIKAYWVVDGLDGSSSSLLAGSWNDTSPAEHELDAAPLASLSIPAQVQVKLVNSHETVTGSGIIDAECVQISGVTISASMGVLGLEVTEAAMQNPVVPGFTRTQYGTVDIAEQGRCNVTMVTDPDGSAVAEIKDPEGRTIYKIVNPMEKYTSLFRDHVGNAFQPSSPKKRSADEQSVGNLDNGQINLLTQYLFDEEGHLRIVVPPLGMLPSLPLWGFPLSDPKVRAAFLWRENEDGSLPALAPLSYATHNSYDASGHLVATYNPDEGLTRFKVDQKGRVHFSQTEGQRDNGSSWTRTYYDQIFRVVAVGQATTQPPPSVNGEGYGVVASDAPLESFSDIAGPSSLLSLNRYDTYGAGWAGEDDPVTFFRDASPALGNLLPANEIWSAFADGHLVQTYELDPTIAESAPDRRRTVERYFYDQDGHIVIRWVSLRGSDGAWRHFAIGIFYDFAGRVKRLVYPSGPGGVPLQVAYTYDDLGRLFAVGTPQDKAYFARYAYEPTGEVRAIIYGPGEGFVAKRALSDPQGWLRELTVQGR